MIRVPPKSAFTSADEPYTQWKVDFSARQRRLFEYRTTQLRNRLHIAGLALIALFIAATAAFAQPACTERDKLTTGLMKEHSENVLGRGLATDGTMMEVWANPETGSWSVVRTKPDGTACLVASGQAYDGIAYVFPGEPL